MKKNNIGLTLLISGIILFVFCILVSFFWYKVFSKDKVAVSNLTIALKDKGKGINVKQLAPENDEEGLKVVPYAFDIINNGTIDGEYQVLIEDSVAKDKDGYKEEELLSREQLKYQLTLNGKVIASEQLSKIKKNILDTRIIGVNKTNSYELRIWLPLSAANTKWQGKNYHYKVAVSAISEEE